MKGFIEVRYVNQEYLINLQNVAYIYPVSENASTIVFNYPKGSNSKLLTVEDSYEEIKVKINAALE